MGGTLAWVLGAAGYKICMVESQAYQNSAVNNAYDERSVALSYGSKVLLQKFGLWKGLSKISAPIEHIHISERTRFGAARLHAKDEAVSALGYVVRNSVYLNEIYAKLRKMRQVKILSQASITSIEQTDSQLNLMAEESGQLVQLRCSLLLAADGSQSSTANKVGFKFKETSYEQAAVVANVCCELDHKNTAFERFTNTGPLALLPLDVKVMALVETIDHKNLPAALALSDQQMMQSLQERFGYRLGRFKKIGERMGFPLALSECGQQHKGRVLLMGNSARMLHPVSGQGFNLALRDIAFLAERLSVNGVVEDPGHPTILDSFVQDRQPDQRSVVRFTDSLVRIFRGQTPMISRLRAAVLVGIDILPPVKHLLAKQSMGMNTRLPNLSPLEDRLKQLL